MKNLHRGFAPVIFVIIISVVILGTAGYFAGKDLPRVYRDPPVSQVPERVIMPGPIPPTPEITSADWKTYRNEKYGFEIQYLGSDKVTDVEISGGRQITLGTLRVRAVTEAWHDGILKPPANCDDYPPEIKTSQVTINGVSFVKGDVSTMFSGMNSKQNVVEYCTVRNGTAYSIITHPDYVPSTFKFIDQRSSTGARTLYREGDFVYVDFSLCKKMQDTFSVAFGSTIISIEGIATEHLKDNECVLRYGGEVENPNWDFKLDTLCTVPVTLGLKKFTVGYYGVDMSPIEAYCKKETAQ